MFNFLKEKLKKAVSVFSKKAEEQAEVAEAKPEVQEKLKPAKVEKPKKVKVAKTKVKEKVKPEEKPVEVQKEEVKVAEPEVKEKKKGFFSKLFSKKEKVEEIKDEVKQPEEKKGFFATIKEKIITTTINSSKFDDLFFELEMALLENNVAFDVVEKIKTDLKDKIVDKPIKRGTLEALILEELKNSINNILNFEVPDLIKLIKSKKDKPFIIVFFGQNGVGKTTTIAKIAKLCLDNDLKVVLSASDTFRASAIEQIQEWGAKLNIKVIFGQYNADPASIAFDAIKHCKAHNIDVVLIDTAGRQHSNDNLMREMEKIVRVSKPDLKLFIGESLTGNDVLNQGQQFNEVVGIDGLILTKADVDEKGGAILSVSYVLKKPVLFLGTGQLPTDLKKFDKEEILKNLRI